MRTATPKQMTSMSRMDEEDVEQEDEAYLVEECRLLDEQTARKKRLLERAKQQLKVLEDLRTEHEVVQRKIQKAIQEVEVSRNDERMADTDVW